MISGEEPHLRLWTTGPAHGQIWQEEPFGAQRVGAKVSTLLPLATPGHAPNTLCEAGQAKATNISKTLGTARTSRALCGCLKSLPIVWYRGKFNTGSCGYSQAEWSKRLTHVLFDRGRTPVKLAFSNRHLHSHWVGDAAPTGLTTRWYGSDRDRCQSTFLPISAPTELASDIGPP